MRIVSNGVEKEIAENLSLYLYLKDEELSNSSGIAVAVNETVIPRSEWENTKLNPKDSILIIKATQGG